MKGKSTHLLFLLLFGLLSCNSTVKNYSHKQQASKYFVKVIIDLEITRCEKKPSPINKKPCEAKVSKSSGSGLIIGLSKRHKNQIVLSAGHVCTSKIKNSEDDKYTYSVSENIKVLDRNAYIHDASVILSTLPPEGGDLCSLYVPTLEYLNPEGSSNITLSHTKPRTGENIYYVGAPWGVYHPPSALILEGIFSGDIDEISSLASIPAAPGSSGSVILSAHNRIYGVIYAVHPAFHYASVLTSHEETKRFLIRTKEMIGDL